MNIATRLLIGAIFLALPITACGKSSRPASGVPPMPESMKYAAKPTTALEINSAVFGEKGPTATVNGKSVSSTIATNVNSGIVIPDGKGGVIVIPGDPKAAQHPNYLSAREFKLKIRELAEQLISGIEDKALMQAVALPTSFVNVDDLEQTSSFGRLITEQLFYEFNQRGFAVKEYRSKGTVHTQDGEGDFYLSRALGDAGVNGKNAVVVAGTYYADKQSIIVNARLIRPSDGQVLRSANLVFQSSPTMQRMLAKTGKKINAAHMQIRDVRDTHPQSSENPIDRGADVH